MTITEALKQLEVTGHAVNYEPVEVKDGRKYYHVDGLPRDEEQIMEWVIEGVKPGH